MKLSRLSPTPSPSLSFPSVHRPPSATDSPQLCLAFLVLGTKIQGWGQHKEATPVGASQSKERASKLYFPKGERKDTEVKEKLYKLPRGEQNRHEAQPKPGPQRETQGRSSLPWAEGKAIHYAFRSLPERRWPKHCPGKSALTDPTVNEHCYQVPGICSVYSETRQKTLASFKCSICCTKRDVTSSSAAVPTRQPHHSMLKTCLSSTSNVHRDSVWQ